MGYYSFELKQLVEEAKWSNTAQQELDEYIADHPSEWAAYEEEQAEENKKEDDFEPGSDMHTWATTRFF